MPPLGSIFGTLRTGEPQAEIDTGGLFPPDPSTETILVTAFGIDTAGLDAALDQSTGRQRGPTRIVCLTDQPDFLPLRRRGVAFEYLPRASARTDFATPAIWQAYLTERYDILIAKWRPSRVVTAGKTLDAFLAG